MKRTLLAVGLALASMAAFANTDASAKNDTLAEMVTSLCRDAGVTKVDMPKCEKRVQAIVVNAVIAHNSALACLNSPEKVKQFGLNEECGAFERDSKTVDEWQRAILSAPQK